MLQIRFLLSTKSTSCVRSPPAITISRQLAFKPTKEGNRERAAARANARQELKIRREKAQAAFKNPEESKKQIEEQKSARRAAKVDLDALSLSFPLKKLPSPTPGWIAPLGGTETLPFKVERSGTNNLPVYTLYRHRGSQRFTELRHISGDIQAFKQELSKVVLDSVIEERLGTLLVHGIWSREIKTWLTRLGF